MEIISFKRLWFAIVLIGIAGLTACGAGGGTDDTSAVGTILSAPGNVTTLRDPGEITVSWDAVPGASSYNVYRSATPGVARATGLKVPVSDSSTKLIDRGPGLDDDTKYYYVVTAVNSSGESPESAEIPAQSVTSPPPPPA